MKQTIFRPFVFALSIIFICFLATTSCNEPNIIGADVIDPDRPDVEFTDTLTIFATSVTDDSTQTFDDLQLLSTYFCGNLNDPIFGNSQAIINTQLRLTGTPDTAVFEGIPTGDTQLDSAFFILQYDTVSFYGKANTSQNIAVHLLDEAMDNNATYFSNQDFAAIPGMPLGEGIFNPSQFDTTFAVVISGDTIHPPQLRIPININNPLFTDFLWNENSLPFYQNDTSLLQILNGVKIQADTTMPTDLMMAFNLRSSISGLYLHYSTLTDTSSYRFQINSNAAQMVHYRHDTDGAIVDDFIENEVNGDSLFFVQGLSGLDAKIRIPYAKDLGNVIINHAQLEFTIATILPEDDPIFHENPIEQVLISKKNEDLEMEFISDVNESLIAQDITGIFGGDLTSETKNGVVLKKYTMNISDHFQDMVDGIETSDELFILAIPKAQTAQRSIIFGPGHSQHPIKLNITYTINQ